MRNRIIIVGAGSTGSSIAYYLSKMRKSGENIVLIDGKGIGSGMTSFSSALVRTHYSQELVARMALYSLRIFERFDEIGYSGFTRTGMIVLVSRDQKDFFEKNVAMLQKTGINELLIDRSEVEKLAPYLSLNDNFYEKAAYEPESGYADPVAVANSFASKAIEKNVSYIKDTVIKIKSEDNRIVLESGKEINYDKVILATNIWTNSILQNSNADILPLKISPHPIVIMKRPEKYQGSKPIIFDLLQKVYFKPEGKTLFIGGSFDAKMDEISIKLDEMDNYSTASFDYITDYSKMVVERIPLMKDGGFHSSYYGFYDNSPDGQPIIDSCEKLGLKNVYCIAGLSGHGFKLSPAFGFMVSEMVLYNNFSVFDWTKFNLNRFKNGKSEFESYDGLGTIG